MSVLHEIQHTVVPRVENPERRATMEVRSQLSRRPCLARGLDLKPWSALPNRKVELCKSLH